MKLKLILLVMSIIISCVCAEIILRINGKYATYTERTDTGGYVSPFATGFSDTWYRIHKPNERIAYANKEFSASWLTNNEGFDDTIFPLTKKRKRILVIGDSFTEGSGAPNDSSYPRQLANMIKSSAPEPLEVWNCGIGGSDLFFEYVLFRDKLLKYKPDMIIVTINNTDINETEIRGGFARFGKDGKTHYKKGPWFEPLFAHSFIVRGIVFDLFHYNWQFSKMADEQKDYDSSISQLCVAMDSFAILCARDDIKLLFVFHPMENELEKKTPYFADRLIAYCRANGYEYIDVREVFYKMGIDMVSAPSLYWPNDGHFNSRGYNMLALSVWSKIAVDCNNNFLH